MPYQRSYIPFAKGIDQSVDDRVRVADQPELIFNGYHRRTGAIHKRNGFLEIGVGAGAPGDGIGTGELIRGMLSTGDELLVHTSRALYGHIPDLDAFRFRGAVGPCVGGIDYVFSGVHTHPQGDSAEVAGVTLRIAQRYGLEASASSYEIVATVVKVDGVRSTQELFVGIDAAAKAGDQPHCPHATWCEDLSGPSPVKTLVGLYVQGANTAGGDTLRRISYNAQALLSTPPVVPTTVVSDVDFAGQNIRVFDCVGRPGGDYIIGYIQHSTNEIILMRFNVADALVTTTTLDAEPPYRRMALCIDPDADQLGLLVEATDGQGIGSMLLYAWDLSLGGIDGPNWGPFTVETFAADTFTSDNLGVGYGIDHLGVGRMACVYAVENGQIAEMHARTVRADGVSGNTLSSRFNLAPRCAPFWVRGYAYVHADTVMGLGLYTTPLADAHEVASPLVEASGLYSLNDSKYDSEPTFVGLWDVGVAPFADLINQHRRGNCNHSYYASTATAQGAAGGQTQHAMFTNEVRFATVTIKYIIAQTSGFEGVRDQTMDMNEMVLDFDSAPMATVVNRGTALIGGSFMAWYDGDRTTEVGHTAPPVPASILETAETGGFAAGDQSYQAIWKSFDARGIQHRSPPSILLSLTVSGTDNGIALIAKTNPATLRLGIKPVTLDWYRDVDGARQRVTESARHIENNKASHLTAEFEDGVKNPGVFLYTTGGELDEISPEGARIPAVVGGRVFLGDLFRRERIQYSKPYSPGGPNDEAKAPGFNEDFGFVLPDGETVTLLSGIDDKVIIGSRKTLYALVGRGPLNDGSQNDYSGLELISSDVGCRDPRSVVQFPGGLLFQSDSGDIYQLDRALGLRPIGGAVTDELETRPAVTSACLVPEQQQVRFTVDTADGAGNGRILVFDYLQQAWYVWEPKVGSATLALVASCMHDGLYHIATRTAVYRENPDDCYDPDSTFVPLKVKTGQSFGTGPGGWQRVRRFMPLLRREDRCNITVSLFHDYESTADVSHTWTEAEIDSLVAPDSRVQLNMSVRRQRCEAIQLLIEDSASSGTDTGAGFSITGATLEWLPRRGLPKVAKEGRS